MTLSTALTQRRRLNGFIRPVLKHGPRSLTYVRVHRCVKPACAMKVTAGIAALATDQSTERGLSMSILVRTRKMVNYACEGQTQGKL